MLRRSVLLLPLAVCLAAWRWRGGAWQHAALLPLSLLAATAVAHLAKWWFARPRPEGSALIALPADWSYPSAHAMQATAFALALWFCLGPSGRRRVLAWTLVGLVFAVGLSRIYLQVHFPSDVLVGTVAGALCALAMRVALDPVAAPGACEVRR